MLTKCLQKLKENKEALQTEIDLNMSRLIKEAIDAGKIKSKDNEESKKYSLYVPYWA